jgi:hypothetical protein
MKPEALDQCIARLQHLEPFEIQAVGPDGAPQPWYVVTGDIVRELVIYEPTLAEQVQSIAAQLGHWGRLAAQAKRVWEIEERAFRQWKATQVLALSEPPDNPEQARVWKKPSEARIEAAYRTSGAYADWSARVERAEEAFNAATAIVEAFRAKASVLRWAVFKGRDENLHFAVP